MPGGAFTPAARAAIMQSHLGVCVACGRPATEAHHRAPRGMGGTSNPDVAEPHVGLPVCRRHHAWIESRRDMARTLGWLIPRPDPDVPFWTVTYGWCTWTLLTDGPPCWCVRINVPSPGPDADLAVAVYKHQEKK